MRVAYHILIFILIAAVRPAIAPGQESTFDRGVQQGMQLVMSHQYQAAETHWRQLEEQHPAQQLETVFYAAAGRQMEMFDLDRVLDGKALEQALQRVQSLARRRSSTGDGFDGAVYTGSALGLLSMYYHLRDEYAAALQTGLKSIRYLDRAQKLRPKALEPLLGLGIYKYWSGTISRRFAWLPFVEDEREAGIDMLQRVTALPQGQLVAWNQLAWALLDMDRPSDAVARSLEGLEKFPDSRFLLWPLAEGFLTQQQYAQAGEQFATIRTSLETDGLTGEYVYLKCLVKSAECARQLGEDVTALVQQALAVKVHKDHRRRAEKFHDRAQEMLEER